METFMWRRLLFSVPAAIIFIAGLVAWDLFLLPSSLTEALFRYRLNSAAQAQKKEIDLSGLATFEWDEVCDHHPYDGEFNYPKYGRTYSAPKNAAHDGVWVLLFIEKDGSPTYISGSCTHGGAHIGEFGCLARAQAVFRLQQSPGCPFYAAATGHERNPAF